MDNEIYQDESELIKKEIANLKDIKQVFLVFLSLIDVDKMFIQDTHFSVQSLVDLYKSLSVQHHFFKNGFKLAENRVGVGQQSTFIECRSST